MSNYENGCIYIIKSKDETISDSYIGSTTNFERRKYQHKHNINLYTCVKHKYKLYQFIREHGGWDNFTMSILCHHSCECKHELMLKEKEFVLNLMPTLNSQVPLRTRQEWVSDNREYINKKSNDYYHNNKDKCLASQKKWSNANKDKIALIKKKYYEKKKLKEQTNASLSV